MEESMVQSKMARMCVCGREGEGREGGFKYEKFSRNRPHQSLQNSEQQALIGTAEITTITGTMRKSDSNSSPKTVKENQC
jgi:hypothetical protein